MTDLLSLPLSQLDRPCKFHSRVLDAERLGEDGTRGGVARGGLCTSVRRGGGV